MTTAKSILSEWLREHDMDGLYNADGQCACLRDDLMPCDSPCSNCQPGKRVDYPGGKCPCGEGHDWHIVVMTNDHYADAWNWVCSCGERCDPSSAQWRWSGHAWEHCHGDPLGHVTAFREAWMGKVIDTPRTYAAWDAYDRRACGLQYIQNKMEEIERDLIAREKELAEAKKAISTIFKAWNDFVDAVDPWEDVSEEMSDRESDLYCKVQETIKAAMRERGGEGGES